MVAVRYAYDVFRRFPDDVHSYVAVMQSVGFPLGKRVEFPPVCVVASGVAVEYTEHGIARWLIVEDAENPSPTRDEHPLDDPLVVAMLDHRAGDTVTLRPSPMLRTAIITRLISKYEYRVRQCIAEIETRFPTQRFLFSMQVPEIQPGKPDIKPLLDFLKTQQESQQAFDEWYRNHPVSPLMYAVVKNGASAFDALSELLAVHALPYRTFHGAAEEIESAVSSLAKASCAIDVSAAAVLFALFQIEEGLITKILDACGKQCIIPEPVWLDILHAQNVMLDAHPQKLTLGRFIAALQKTWTVVPPNIAGSLDTGTARQVRELFGVAAAGAIECARNANCALWTDDAGLAVFTPGYGMSRVWSQAVFQAASEKGVLSEAEFALLTARLLQHRVEFTACSMHTLIAAAHRCNWNFDASPVRECLESLRDGRLNLESVVRVLFQFMKYIVQFRPSSVSETPQLVRALNEVAQLPNGRQIIGHLRENADNLFGLDVFGSQRFRQHCDAWLDGQAGQQIIIP